MRSETVIVGEITATVRSRSRRTAIVEATYMQAIVKAHPEIAEYEQALYALMRPNLPVDLNGQVLKNLTPVQEAIWHEYVQKSVNLKRVHPIGAAFAEEAGAFVPLLARIVDLGGAPFGFTSPQFLDAQVLEAFDDWLDEAHEDFWEVTGKAVVKVDAPLTPVNQRPPETLTEAEQVDPLSEPVGEIGKSG